MIDLQDRNQTPITHHEEETQGLMAIEEEMVAVLEDKIKKYLLFCKKTTKKFGGLIFYC